MAISCFNAIFAEQKQSTALKYYHRSRNKSNALALHCFHLVSNFLPRQAFFTAHADSPPYPEGKTALCLLLFKTEVDNTRANWPLCRILDALGT